MQSMTRQVFHASSTHLLRRHQWFGVGTYICLQCLRSNAGTYLGVRPMQCDAIHSQSIGFPIETIRLATCVSVLHASHQRIATTMLGRMDYLCIILHSRERLSTESSNIATCTSPLPLGRDLALRAPTWSHVHFHYS